MALSEQDVETRRAFADAKDLFQEQHDWYDQRATDLKSRAQRSDLLVIGAGAIVAAVSALAASVVWASYFVAALGVLIAVVQGAQRVFRSAEIWPGYRMAAEAMKAEYRMFIYGGGIYAIPFDEACALYLERLHTILADEQKSYFEDIRAAGAVTSPASQKSSS
jgi:hypothetical protein